mgnify:CR=1 FL=1
MTEVVLGPRQLGAEYVIALAKERATGKIAWTQGDRRTELLLVGGRPQMAEDSTGQLFDELDGVKSVFRRLAVAINGRCSFQEIPLSQVAHFEKLKIDTIFELVSSLIYDLDSVHIDSICDARAALVVEPTAFFERLTQAVQKFETVTVDKPTEPVPFRSLTSGADAKTLRLIITLKALGALKYTGEESRAAAPRASNVRVWTPSGAVPSSARATKNVESISSEFAESLPDLDPLSSESTLESSPPVVNEEDLSPNARRALNELTSQLRTLGDATHYKVLDISQTSAVDEINRAYLRRAREWHSDRFAVFAEPRIRRAAEELFMKAEEAYRVLNDEVERANYDLVLDRKAKGLPTDPVLVLEADELFRKGQTFIRRGNAVAAEEGLARAVELNPTEAEYWSYYGWAYFSKHGEEGLEKAQEALTKAQELKPELASAFEFLGRIARARNEFKEAKRHLMKSIELNGGNPDVERELRLISMRQSQSKKSSANLMDKLKNLFQK